MPGYALCIEVTAAEIDNLGSFLKPHDIFQLDIPMNDVIQMQFLEASADLIDDIGNELKVQMVTILQRDIIQVMLHNDGILLLR